MSAAAAAGISHHSTVHVDNEGLPETLMALTVIAAAGTSHQVHIAWFWPGARECTLH